MSMLMKLKNSYHLILMKDMSEAAYIFEVNIARDHS